jgi:hypothetical protein
MSYIAPYKPELNPYGNFKVRPSIPNIIQIITLISGVKVSDRRKILPLHHLFTPCKELTEFFLLYLSVFL